jgi:hypothetical protein
VRAAASVKRLYVEKMPYKVGGFCRWVHNGPDISHKFSQYLSQARQLQRRLSLNERNPKDVISRKKNNEVEESLNVYSIADKYRQMCSSMKHRLTFGKSFSYMENNFAIDDDKFNLAFHSQGKSAIHGWGVFTKANHQAGDMV